jgi:predicted nucleic acid-binding protein
MNRALLDANVLIAAHDEAHTEHARARRYVDGLDRFCTSPQTQGAFLRFFTRPWRDAEGHEQPPRMSPAEAMRRLADIIALKQHLFLPDDLPFTQVSLRSLSGFKQWNDAYLIAKAGKTGIPLATLERKLENMDNVSKSALVQIP